MSLKVVVAEKRTDMGKKTEESAGGTTNSIDPLHTQHTSTTFNIIFWINT